MCVLIFHKLCCAIIIILFKLCFEISHIMLKYYSVIGVGLDTCMEVLV